MVILLTTLMFLTQTGKHSTVSNIVTMDNGSTVQASASWYEMPDRVVVTTRDLYNSPLPSYPVILLCKCIGAGFNYFDVSDGGPRQVRVWHAQGLLSLPRTLTFAVEGVSFRAGQIQADSVRIMLNGYQK